MQQFALTMLMWQEEQDAQDARVDQVKLALLASKQATLGQLFPEYAPEDIGPKTYESDPDVDEARRVIESIGQLERSGVLRFEEIVEGEEPDQWL